MVKYCLWQYIRCIVSLAFWWRVVEHQWNSSTQSNSTRDQAAACGTKSIHCFPILAWLSGLKPTVIHLTTIITGPIFIYISSTLCLSLSFTVLNFIFSSTNWLILKFLFDWFLYFLYFKVYRIKSLEYISKTSTNSTPVCILFSSLLFETFLKFY